MSSKPGVVVTGLGAVTPIGIGREGFWQGLEAGVPGIRPVTLFDTSRFGTEKAGEISGFHPEEFLGAKGLKYLNRTTQLLMSAVFLCMKDAGIKNDARDFLAYDPVRIGAAVGTTHGILHSIGTFDRESITEGWRYVSPMGFANTVINAPAGHLAIRENIQGLTVTVSTGYCSALDAVGMSVNYLACQRVGCMVAGAAEELCEEGFVAWAGGPPSKDGIEPGEGSVMLAIEQREAATARKAPILCEVLGYGAAFSPDDDAAAEAVRLSLDDAGIPFDAIERIVVGNDHRQSGVTNELDSLQHVFGTLPAIAAIRPLVGDAFSAESGMQLGEGVRLLHRKIAKTVLVIASNPSGSSSAVVLSRQD